VFIVFDGIDGAGKSTQIELTRAWLIERGHVVETLYDPGSTSLGLKLRELLLGNHDLTIAPEAETLMFVAARAQLVAEKIRPALESGKVVLCDRYTYSTVVYQGHAGGVDVRQIRAANDLATGGLQPDLAILFDLPAEVAFERIGGNLDRMESRGLAYFEKVRQGFLVEAQKNLSIARVVDATASPTAIQEIIQAHLREVLMHRESAR
jgi:dTMP kinase